MSIEWFLYLTNIVKNLNDNLSFVVFVLIIILGIMWFIKGVVKAAEERDIFLNIYYYSKWAMKIFIPVILISSFIPSERTMYLILGAHIIKQSDLPSKVELVIEKKLDEYLKEDDKK